MNALRSQALPQTDFRLPGQVLGALNNAFQMDQQNGLFFTIWYGVYHKPARRIDYSGGGHPPGLLFSGPSSEQIKLEVLEASGPITFGTGRGHAIRNTRQAASSAGFKVERNGFCFCQPVYTSAPIGKDESNPISGLDLTPFTTRTRVSGIPEMLPTSVRSRTTE
jgi:hypothetical protein